jgi:uncharacterized protein (TIGR02186 family)
MRTRILLLLIGLVALLPGQARAQALVADLSDHLIAITAGFAGTDVLLFGATEGEGDVVVVLRGPEIPVVVRRKTRAAGIWINTERIVFNGAPAFYRVAASRPLDEVANTALRARQQIGIEYLRIATERELTPQKLQNFRQGLIRNKEREGLYSPELGTVSFLGPRLFRTRFYLPANVPPGSYTVEVLLVRNNQVIAAQTTPMLVNKTGIGADVYDFAHRHAAVYGLLAVLIAVSTGWAAGTVFRKA